MSFELTRLFSFLCFHPVVHKFAVGRKQTMLLTEERATETPAGIDLAEEITRLKKEMNAVILAHY